MSRFASQEPNVGQQQNTVQETDNAAASSSTGIQSTVCSLSCCVPGSSPLFKAVRSENLAEVRKWAQRSNVNVVNSTNKQWTVLVLACRIGNLQIVKCLKEAGGNLWQIDAMGRTLLHHAGKSAEMLGFLVDCGLNPNQQDTRGNTPLHACDKANWAVVRLLLESGADVNIPNDGGVTPLNGLIHAPSPVSLITEYICEVWRGCSYDCCEIREQISHHAAHTFFFSTFWRTSRNVRWSDRDVYRNWRYCYYRCILKMKVFHSCPFFSTDVLGIDEFMSYSLQDLSQTHLEVKHMKTKYLSDSLTSYSAILREGLGNYRNMTALRSLLGSNELDQEFPIYGETIRRKIALHLRRLHIIEMAVGVFSPHVPLPEEMVTSIVEYLDNMDIYNILAICS